jgi:hypothetical protein
MIYRRVGVRRIRELVAEMGLLSDGKWETSSLYVHQAMLEAARVFFL